MHPWRVVTIGRARPSLVVQILTSLPPLAHAFRIMTRRGLGARVRTGSPIWAALALVLALVATLAPSFHHHAGGVEEPRCAMCVVAHAPADIPTPVALP